MKLSDKSDVVGHGVVGRRRTSDAVARRSADIALRRDPVIAKLEIARNALATVTTAQEAKQIADAALAAEVYARRQHLGEEAIGLAHSVKIQALGRLADLLKAMPKATGTRGQLTGSTDGSGGVLITPPEHTTPTYADLGVDKEAAKIARLLVELPTDVREAIAARETTVKQAKKALQREQRMEAGATATSPPTVTLTVEGMDSLLSRVREVDAIITDPPYGREAIPLYGQLVTRATAALKPDGLLAVMCGQSYLPELCAVMQDPRLPYRWTMAYLTPGGQSAQLWDRHVNTFWKPVLIFGRVTEPTRWLGDVVRSSTNDNDKRFHDWGQSESGMVRLIEALTEPGALICDPFCGGGTTAIVAHQLGRRFVGCDVDPEAVTLTRGRFA